jgi:hypothetical protein
LVAIFIESFTNIKTSNLFVSNNGIVRFTTKGPFGIIVAQSKKLTGNFDPTKKTFTFSIPITSFEGFANPLQKQHFNDKYMESDKIPMAVFKGKIIEDIDFSAAGVYPIRAKGAMTIHGVEKEIIVKSKMTIKSGQIMVESFFNVLLVDYNIKIPTIVNQKVKDDIAVEVKMDLLPEK